MEITLTEEELEETRRAIAFHMKYTENIQRTGAPVKYEPGALEERLKVCNGILNKLDGKEV